MLVMIMATESKMIIIKECLNPKSTPWNGWSLYEGGIKILIVFLKEIILLNLARSKTPMEPEKIKTRML